MTFSRATCAVALNLVSPLIADSALGLAAGMGVLAAAGCASWTAYLALRARARTNAGEAKRLA